MVANLIYDLSPLRQRQAADEPPDPSAEAAAGRLRPSAAVRELADRARQMPTALWFDDPRQLDELLLCGKLTACYNLLQWTEKRLREGGPDSLQPVRDRLAGLWDELSAAAEQLAGQTPAPAKVV